MKSTVLLLIGLGIIPLCNAVWATDLGTLGSPYVTIYPHSGPPGTKITITVSHIPDISKTSYPYPDLYIYLPFSQPFGTTLTSHCGGQDCFPIYTYDDAANHDSADRIITFSLPSTNNSKPIFLNGFENSVCDVTSNGKILERFSTLCNTKDEPSGIYQINLGWVLESDSGQNYTTDTIPFLVTPGTSPSGAPVADNGDTILKEYQNGTISQTQFYTELKARSWTDEQIRQALAVIGKLPHQMGISGPDYKLPIYQNSTINSTNTVQKNTANENIAHLETQLNANTHVIRTQDIISLQIQQNSSAINHAQNNSTTQLVQNNPMWNNIILVLSIIAAAIMGGVTIFVKIYRNKTNTR
ncbi:MAG: hypothetical protein KGH86_06235 [Thaumarchaeota archaeon]|nr:hypothetical protein [Nitrososphaerota archaeon]MDE1817519.1 hypothetical protein [Nitrososphaerota archaeon]MDE1876407.1 hypothetical protein [Nitrososphaerota archaeon]